MTEILIENAVQIVSALIMALIGVLGTWIAAKFGKKQELSNISIAQKEVIALAQQTVGELQQTLVDGLKAAHEDGKLTPDEIDEIRSCLIVNTYKKMSEPTKKLLNAAAVDIVALIRGAAEAWISRF